VPSTALKTENLFKTGEGRWATVSDLAAALRSVGAHDCQVLYMHTGLSFGVPNLDLRRTELLEAIYETIRALGVPTLCMPTFTFSLCNGEDYNVTESKSRMGALNEFIRRRPEAVRSVDPLLSVALVGEDRDLVENLGHESIGANSTFDKLSRRRGVKFLFLGVPPGDCFTYTHHLEWRNKAPYRYNRDFRGRITAGGKTYEDTYALFVRYGGVTPNAASHVYARMLEERGILRSAAFGDNRICCFPEPEASAVCLELLRKQPDFFIERPFSPRDADRTFVANNMLTL
jgi:aminoglycoside 3-N-acetyltransferase